MLFHVSTLIVHVHIQVHVRKAAAIPMSCINRITCFTTLMDQEFVSQVVLGKFQFST